MIVARCVICNAEYTEEQIKEVTGCPNCKTTSLPNNPADDITIKINWHELRVLCMFAERWANSIKETTDSNIAIAAIAKRLEKQEPVRAKNMPLTLAGEVDQLRKAIDSGELKAGGLETNIDESGKKIAGEFN